MEALCPSETWVLTRATRRNIQEDGILHSHRHENLKSYIIHFVIVRGELPTLADLTDYCSKYVKDVISCLV
jgi:hypothetical protein